MIELKILIDELDYDSIADYLIPALAESMAKERKGGVLGGVLAGNPEAFTSMARTLLHTMSQEKRDELLVQQLNKNREQAAAKGEKGRCRQGYPRTAVRPDCQERSLMGENYNCE